ncbi:MAG: immunoglobulin domain-containing protein, partial [Ignavibacteriae bacterium]|nr:immunoglobulin domain-containing protein [Ignavibacteriota bacterium]
PPSTIVSDDFHDSPLNTGLWTFVNPQADATQSITGAGTTDALLNIVVPSGTRHDIYDQGYIAPRIMQAANNTDFTVEAKFQSTFTAAFQHEGIVVEQDANNVIRFDIYFDGTNTNIFAASMIGGFGAPTNHININIGSGAQNPAYMRVNRTGNVWTLSYSLNGTTFTQAGQFTLPFTVTQVGVWGGNSGTNPAFTLLCDYFFNTASPIVPEDPTGPPAPPSITQQPTNQTVNEGQTATFTVAATGNPDPAYQWQKNNVDISGATNASYTTPATVFADSGATFRCVVSNSQGTVTSNSAILNVNRVGPTITQHPANQSVQAGQTANFSVTATGSPTLAYQWQKNNVNIGGASTSNYTTPATVAGDDGSTFRCIVSNAAGTVTSNSATLTVITQPAGTIVSDDFHTGTLNNSLWTFTNPNTPSTLSFTGMGTSDALLSIAIPGGGSGHDAWTGGNFAPRIMQTITNGDFQAEVKFQSTPSSAYQIQGIIVEQDANNYLRFDFLHIGSGLRAYAASFVGGNPTQRINVATTSASNLWLRVTRTGNSWTLGVSTNGTTFTTAGTFSHTLTVSKIGPFAGNATGATAPAFTALIDYFFNTAYPSNPEDPVAPIITTHPTDQSATLGNTATFTVVASGASLAYQWQKNNVDIGGATSSSYTTPSTVQPDSGATFRCVVSNSFGTVTSNVAMLHVLPPAVPSTLVSDDFSAATLNGSLWTYVNPLADATQSMVGTGTSDALLSIAIPGGTAHDLFTNGYQVPRIMQNANNTDFTVEAKFQSVLTAQYQSEGIVVEQDANNVMRFDIYFDGTNTNVFAASFIGGFGSPTTHINSGIAGGAQNPAYLRINRAGNNWTVSYSLNGTTFTQAGTFTQAITVAKVGVWGGNSGTNPAFTLLCDYFFNNASPINPEDPTGPPVAPTITQQPTNQTVNEGQTAAFIVAANGNPSPTYQWQKNTVDISGATNASYTTPATVFADSGATFRCIVGNSQGTVTSNTAILNVNRVGPTITQHPSNQTVTVGQTAQFSVTATGSPTLAYQWQKNNVDIGGANSSGYTTPATVQGDSGATFRCIVSNSIGTVTSNNAILNVNSAAPGQPVSDDFSSGTLNASLWTFINPGTPSTLSFTGTGTSDARLSIAIPAGNAHDVYANGIEAPRIMQTIGNVDFTVEAKFESTIGSRYQLQGMIIQQDLNNFIRTDFYHDGTGIHIFAATFVAGSPTVRFDGLVPASAALWLRVNRAGSNWTIGYSTDGTSFTNSSPFSFSMTTSAIGVFAGNQGNTSTTAPAFTMLCDYFFNVSSPINPEDPSGPPSGPTITQHPNAAVVDEGGRATFTVVASGNPLNYQWQKNGVNINGATNASYATPANLLTESGNNFRCIVSNALGTSTSNQALLTVNSLTGPGINVWYGTTENFGTVGDPIPFVNILGNASDADGIQSLRYTLNGGSAVTLQTNADGRRIDEVGNFIIEIPRTSLNTGSNAIVITMTDNLNNVTTKNVTLNYSGGGNTWPQSYTIDWNSVTNILSVAQPSDGLWAPDTNGVRVMKPRYDRLLTIGEQTTWSNYEVSFPFTVYSLAADAFSFPSNNPGVGVIMRWNGHTDSPLSGANPKTGYLPLGSIGWFTWSNPTTGNMQLLDNNANPAANDLSGFNITFGTRYMFKMKVYSAGVGQAPTYRLKMWLASQAEPGSWNISFTGSASDPSAGCLALVAHECDVNFGNITVVPTVSAARPVRSPDDIVAMYRFGEGSGNTIHDVAAQGEPAELTVEKPEAASWINGGGIALNMPSAIQSAQAGLKILQAVKTSNAITVEAWLKPTLVSQSSPLHFFSLVERDGVRLLDVQSTMNNDRSAISFEAQMQTAAASMIQPIGSLAKANGLTHVVFTRDASSEATLYLNGEPRASGSPVVNFADWNDATLVLGGDESGWLGEYQLVVVYSRAITAEQVRVHFEGGPDAELAMPVPTSMAPTMNNTMTVAPALPKEFALYQNYPNPFNPSTTIKFDLPKDENVTLTLYNMIGQQVATLVNERKTAGSYSINWNAQNFATGVYIYRFKAGNFVQTRKLVLVK